MHYVCSLPPGTLRKREHSPTYFLIPCFLMFAEEQKKKIVMSQRVSIQLLGLCQQIKPDVCLMAFFVEDCKQRAKYGNSKKKKKT